MKNPFLFRVFMVIVLSGSWLISSAQSAPDASPSATKNTVYHWHITHRVPKLSSTTENAYSHLPEASYTPPQNIAEWSAAKALRSYASSSNKKVSVLFLFTMDEKGYVRKLKVIKTSDKSSSDALSAMILNTKISGPSYLQNQAVSSYLPCSISIDKNDITIL